MTQINLLHLGSLPQFRFKTFPPPFCFCPDPATAKSASTSPKQLSCFDHEGPVPPFFATHFFQNCTFTNSSPSLPPLSFGRPVLAFALDFGISQWDNFSNLFSLFPMGRPPLSSLMENHQPPPDFSLHLVTRASHGRRVVSSSHVFLFLQRTSCNSRMVSLCRNSSHFMVNEGAHLRPS